MKTIEKTAFRFRSTKDKRSYTHLNTKPVFLEKKDTSSNEISKETEFSNDTLYLQVRKGDNSPLIHKRFSPETTVEEAKRAIGTKLMIHYQRLESLELYLPLTGVYLLVPNRMLSSYYLRNSEEVTLKKKEIPKREVTVIFPLLSETEEIVQIWKETTAMGLIQLLGKKELNNISESCLSVECKAPLPMNETLPIKFSTFYYVTYSALSDNDNPLSNKNSVIWKTKIQEVCREKNAPNTQEPKRDNFRFSNLLNDLQDQKEPQDSKKDPITLKYTQVHVHKKKKSRSTEIVASFWKEKFTSNPNHNKENCFVENLEETNGNNNNNNNDQLYKLDVKGPLQKYKSQEIENLKDTSVPKHSLSRLFPNTGGTQRKYAQDMENNNPDKIQSNSSNDVNHIKHPNKQRPIHSIPELTPRFSSSGSRPFLTPLESQICQNISSQILLKSNSCSQIDISNSVIL